MGIQKRYKLQNKQQNFLKRLPGLCVFVVDEKNEYASDSGIEVDWSCLEKLVVGTIIEFVELCMLDVGSKKRMLVDRKVGKFVGSLLVVVEGKVVGLVVGCVLGSVEGVVKGKVDGFIVGEVVGPLLGGTEWKTVGLEKGSCEGDVLGFVVGKP